MREIVRIYRESIYLVSWLNGYNRRPVTSEVRVRIPLGPPESTQGLLEFSMRTKNSKMGVHVPRLAMDLCKVRGRVRFSSSPQVGKKRIFNDLMNRKFVRQTNEYGILFEMTFRFWRI